jgi:hypothetical protein
MKKPSLSFELEGLLRKKNGWIHISELEDFGRSLGFLSSNVDRTLRKMRMAEKIESELRNFEGTKTTWWKVNMSTLISETWEGMLERRKWNQTSMKL